MNRLWVRLSLAFSAVMLISTLGIVLAGSLIMQSNALQSLLTAQLQTEGGLIDELRVFYRQYGSWEGIDNFWIDHNRIYSAAPGESIVLSVSNADGTFVLAKDAEKANNKANLAALPIEVDGNVKGFLVLIRAESPPPRDQSQFFIQRISGTLLTLGVITALVGIFFGTLMSRSLTAPLNRLAEAAHTIGARKQFKRVKEEGSAEVRELARAFNDMSGALEQAETLRRNMVADVAHELRTPLTVLQGNLGAIVDGIYPLSKDEVSALYTQTRVLSRLVNDLHELSQAEASKLPLNRQWTSIDRLIENQVLTFGALAETEGVKLSCEVQPHLPELFIDAVRVAQVLSNLISNALAHTPNGGTIVVEACQQADQISIAVRDSGQGISAEHLPLIFERFYRADSSRSRQTGGAGLGLAIARALIEAHAGNLTVESEGTPGKGSTFYIHLPTKQQDSH